MEASRARGWAEDRSRDVYVSNRRLAHSTTQDVITVFGICKECRSLALGSLGDHHLAYIYTHTLTLTITLSP
jgi:hypothetical protein